MVSVGTFSKLIGPGVKVGWIQAHPKLLKKITQVGYLAILGRIRVVSGNICFDIFFWGGSCMFWSFCQLFCFIDGN